MSKRLDVLAAVKALMAQALPYATVLGLDGQDAAPARVGQFGRVVVRSGDPGDPEIDLSPLTYNYQHQIPIEVAAYESGGRTSEEAVDDMLVAIGEAIEADRTLGGLVDWIDATAPTTEDIFTDGATPPKGADLLIVATYATTNPLT